MPAFPIASSTTAAWHSLFYSLALLTTDNHGKTQRPDEDIQEREEALGSLRGAIAKAVEDPGLTGWDGRWGGFSFVWRAF